MASLSSTSVSSSTSSLGNTSLRGFGGMVSGIDRDSIVEQMTLGTRTKIANQQKQYTKLEWKQEAYRSLSDKIIDWQDKYASYSSGSCLKDANTFAKNVITLHGKEESTQFVKASGTSQFVDNVAITGVKQLATSTVRQSATHVSETGLQTGLTADALGKDVPSSNLLGSEIRFVMPTGGDGQELREGETLTFTFSSSYEVVEDGKTVTKTIDYCPTDDAGFEKLAEDLTNALQKKELKFSDGTKVSEMLEFKYDSATKQMSIVRTDGKTEDPGFKISKFSSALGALGFDEKTNADVIGSDGIAFSDFNGKLTDFTGSAVKHTPMDQYLTEKKLTFKYDGNQKEIELITKEEKKELDGISDLQAKLDKIKENIQKRLDQAFGKDAVTVSTDGGLRFTTKEGSSSTISVTSSDNELLKNLELVDGASSKVNLNGTVNQDALQKAIGKTYSDDDPLDLEINGIKIEGLTGKSTISDILSKINSTTDAGVKATYVEASGKFMLVSSETGAGRQISLDTGLTQQLFGLHNAAGEYKEDLGLSEGQNAVIDVSYGNGVTVALNRSSNTFDLEGLSVTVSGVFGGEWIDGESLTGKTQAELEAKYGKDNVVMKDGQVEKVWSSNSSGAVTFSAKADVDGVTEKVKSFIEDFNALVTEINKQVTTRPDSDYEPLTDEQRAEMDETSIENWEKKAKEGLLYNDSTIRELSTDVQSIFVKMMNNGASYEDLKKIGITYSEDYTDGGTLVFDEATFRSAMESDPELVSNIFTGGGSVSKGMIDTVYSTLSPYATRYASDNNGKSYGSLIDIAGSEKKPTTLMKNQIYEQLKQMQETIDSLKERLSTEEQRYINQFTSMETLINQYNTQSSYLSQITG